MYVSCWLSGRNSRQLGRQGQRSASAQARCQCVCGTVVGQICRVRGTMRGAVSVYGQTENWDKRWCWPFQTYNNRYDQGALQLSVSRPCRRELQYLCSSCVVRPVRYVATASNITFSE
jgi:hypothetical protein